MASKEMVYKYIDENKDRIIDYLMDLVRIPSINRVEGGNEKPVQDWLANSLRGFDFDQVDEFAVDEENMRPNVVGVLKGSGGGKSLLLNGHMDVVPVAKPEIWHCDPFDPKIIDGKVYGRGTSDMKGGITSAIWAMKALKACGIKTKGDVILQAAIAEESQQAEQFGTVQCLKRGYTADFGIVCEPSDMEVHIASSALFFFDLIVEGKAVHISARNQAIFPQPYGVPSGKDVGVDAFKKSLMFVDYFYRLEEEWNHRYRDKVLGGGGLEQKDSQGVGIFTINPSSINGGVYLGSVPSIVKYTYGVWYPDQLVDPQELYDEIKRGVAAIASTDAFLRENPPTLNIPTLQDWPGFKVDIDHPGVTSLRKSVEDATGEKAVISGFKAVCDAYYLNKHGVDTVIFGPGSLSYSVHGDNEFIPIAQVIDAAKVYASAIIDWCETE
jgi:acetylornithine deacetylase/succinyl-diaminopimelate desuccinylase family protein